MKGPFTDAGEKKNQSKLFFRINTTQMFYHILLIFLNLTNLPKYNRLDSKQTSPSPMANNFPKSFNNFDYYVKTAPQLAYKNDIYVTLLKWGGNKNPVLFHIPQLHIRKNYNKSYQMGEQKSS